MKLDLVEDRTEQAEAIQALKDRARGLNRSSDGGSEIGEKEDGNQN